MKILINENEMIVFAKYMDVYFAAVNEVSMAIDPAEPVELVCNNIDKLEEFLNSAITKKVDKKVIKVHVVPLVRNLIIVVEPEFITDFVILYGDIVKASIPAAIGLGKAFVAMQEVGNEFGPKLEQFQSKWLKEDVFEEHPEDEFNMV